MIPAHPLALTVRRTLDVRRQRALTRYYIDAGAGAIAVGVHTTQFAIHAPASGLLRPVLELAAETARGEGRGTLLIAGVVGPTRQAIREAQLARDLGYHAVLLSMGAMTRATDATLIAHARAVSSVMPVIGFYLQPAVGGRRLDYAFWRGFAEIENVVAIKIAPFDRYATLDVIRAVAAAGRATDIALYTGNDDHIILDLLPRHPLGSASPVRMVGGLLGHWAFWTRSAVDQQRRCARIARAAGRFLRRCCRSRHRSPTPTPPSSMWRMHSPVAFREFTRSFDGSDCLPDAGASIRRRNYRPASVRRLIASAPPIPSWPTMHSSPNISIAG